MLQRWELDPALLPPPPASRQPPTLRPHLQASAPSWSWQHPQQPWLASEAGDGAHAGLHVGRTREEPHVFIHQSQATCAGRVGQAAAGSWLASGARPGRPPLLRGGGGRGAGAEGSPALQMPAGQRGNGLSPFRPRQPSQNPDTPRPPSHSFRRKIRMAATTILAVFLSFAHPPRCQQLLLTPSKASPNPAVSPHFYAPGAQPPFSPHPPDYCSRILTLTLVLLHTAGPATAASVVAGSHLLC